MVFKNYKEISISFQESCKKVYIQLDKNIFFYILRQIYIFSVGTISRRKFREELSVFLHKTLSTNLASTEVSSTEMFFIEMSSTEMSSTEISYNEMSSSESYSAVLDLVPIFESQVPTSGTHFVEKYQIVVLQHQLLSLDIETILALKVPNNLCKYQVPVLKYD